MDRAIRPAVALAVMLSAALLLAACGDGGNGNGNGELAITVSATILEDDAPASVDATTVSPSEDGQFEHTVRVLWEGDDPGSIEDARFAHHIEGDDGGHFITAGRGCGAQWFESDGQVGIVHPCTDDLQIIWLQPGETHEYPVTIYREVEHSEGDHLRLDPGSYVVDEVIHWVITDDSAQVPLDDTHFTVRLTYTVQ